MISIQTAREIALSFEDTDEKMHFDRCAFRVKKKIFSSMSEDKKDVTVKLTPNEQFVYSKIDPEMLHAIPNAWGRQGWTMIHLARINKTLFREVLTLAYCNTAPKKLAEKYRKA